jgi:tetratricopeptide (TPR) repeat protein
LEDARGKLASSEDLILKALALDPDNPDALAAYSALLARVDRPKDAMATWQKLQSVEPFVPSANAITAGLLWLNGQNDAALAMFKALPTLPVVRAIGIARALATAGRYSEAADALQADALLQTNAGLPADIVQAAARVLRSAPAAPPADSLLNLERLSWVYLYAGVPERSLQLQEGMVGLGVLYFNYAWEFWHPDYGSVRKSERFKALMRKTGMLDYWRARGWPDLCHPTTGDDFVCD